MSQELRYQCGNEVFTWRPTPLDQELLFIAYQDDADSVNVLTDVADYGLPEPRARTDLIEAVRSLRTLFADESSPIRFRYWVEFHPDPGGLKPGYRASTYSCPTGTKEEFILIGCGLGKCLFRRFRRGQVDEAIETIDLRLMSSYEVKGVTTIHVKRRKANLALLPRLNQLLEFFEAGTDELVYVTLY